MIKHEGFWWKFGDFCYEAFKGLEWVNDHVSPQWTFFIPLGFVAIAAWVYVQHKYNKASAANGTLK